MSFSITGPSSVTVNVPADYPQVSAASFRAGSNVSGMEFVQGNSSRVLQILKDTGISLDQDIGAGDFTWWVQFSVPASLAGNAGIAALTPNNTFNIPASDNAIALVQQNSDIELVFGNTTNNTRYPLSLSGRTGQIVDITITRTGGSLAVYIDGAPATVSGTNTGAGALPSVTLNTDFALTGGAHSSGNPNAFAGIVFRHVSFNYTLTAARVLDLVRLGVDLSDQWGSKTAIVSPTVLNGGFETVGTTNTFANWIDGTVSGTTINRDTAVFDSGTASLRFDVDGSSSFRNVTTSSILVAGRRYRVTAAFRHNHVSSIIPQIQVPNTVVPFAAVPPNTWQTQTAEFVADGTQLVVSRRGGANNSSQWYDSITVTRIGAFFDLSFEDLYGFQADDRSSNELNGRLIGGCATTLPGTRLGMAQDSLDSNGGEQLFGGQCIPTNALIESILVENISVTGTPTVSIGTTSGGTQVANAVAIGAAGTTTQIVPSVLFSSTGNLWFAWSASGVIRVTVLFWRI